MLNVTVEVSIYRFQMCMTNVNRTIHFSTIDIIMKDSEQK
jgi:hypothetical protein